MKKMLMLIVFAIVLSMTGCAEGESMKLVTLESGASLPPLAVANKASVEMVTKGINEFSFQLAASLVEEHNAENFICSPISVWLPIAALSNATDAAYMDELQKALFVEDLTPEEINQATQYLLKELISPRETADEPHSPIKIVNAAFVRKNLTVNREFAQTFSDYYNGVLFNVDFSSPQTALDINRWASETTNGLIDNIVSSLSPDMLAVFANTVYFSDRWQWEFDASQTKTDVFYSPTEEQTAHFMFREGDNQEYYEDDEIQAIQMDFRTGGGMFVLVPKDGDATGLLSSMTAARFEDIKSSTEPRTGKLLLPRFSIDSGVIKLDEALRSLGIPFVKDQSDTMLAGLVKENVPVQMSEIVQKAMIEVDEKGTTATAVTIIPAATYFPFETIPFEMTCNKPFAFVLYESGHSETSRILFIGAVNYPS